MTPLEALHLRFVQRQAIVKRSLEASNGVNSFAASVFESIVMNNSTVLLPSALSG